MVSMEASSWFLNAKHYVDRYMVCELVFYCAGTLWVVASNIGQPVASNS
jgi:hypothetical protein